MPLSHVGRFTLPPTCYAEIDRKIKIYPDTSLDYDPDSVIEVHPVITTIEVPTMMKDKFRDFHNKILKAKSEATVKAEAALETFNKLLLASTNPKMFGLTFTQWAAVGGSTVLAVIALTIIVCTLYTKTKMLDIILTPLILLCKKKSARVDCSINLGSQANMDDSLSMLDSTDSPPPMKRKKVNKGLPCRMPTPMPRQSN
jgi:hypothetical protein